MGNLTSTLTIALQDDVSGKAGRAASALKQLGASGTDLKRLANASPEMARLARELERLQALSGKIDIFKGASRGLDDLGVALRKARSDLSKADAQIMKHQRTLDYFERKRTEQPARWQKWKDDGLIAGVTARLERATRARDKAAKAVEPAKAAFIEQGQHVRALRQELTAAGVPVKGLRAAEDGLKSSIAGVNAEIARQPDLMARAATAAAKLGSASRDLTRGMSEAGRAQAQSSRFTAGMTQAGRASQIERARRAEETAAAAAARATSRRDARREAMTVVGAGAGLYAGHQAKTIGQQSVLAVADYDHATRSQRVFTDLDEKDQAEVLSPQALRIGQETKFSNTDVVKAQTAAMQGLPSSMDARLKAEVAAGIVENVKYYATLMDTDLKDGAETIRAYLQATGKDISTKEKALTEAQTAVNQIVKMAKLGGMSGEDAQQYVKYAAASATSAGLSSDRMLTLGALARRGGLRGDEAGVFMRSAANKLVAPTREGIAAMNAAGIDHSKFVRMPEKLSTDALESHFRNKMGKGFTPEIRKRLDEINSDKGLLGDRSKYTAAVTEAVGGILGKKKDGTVRASDSRVAAKAAGEFHKLSAQEVDTNGLLEAIGQKKMTAAQLNAMFTDKHGGKFSLTQKQWDEFFASLKEIRKAGNDPNYSKTRSDEVMAGIYGSFENLKGSVENFYLAVGKANEGLLKFTFDGLGNAIDLFSKMPKGAQQAVSLTAGGAALLFALRSAYTLGKSLLGFGGSAALGGSAAALSGSAAALDGAAAALTRAAAVQGAKGAVPGGSPVPAAVAAPVAGGLAAAGVVAGVAVGGAVASHIANEAVKNPDFAKPYLGEGAKADGAGADGGMLGADPAGYGLGAAIQNADTLPMAEALRAQERQAAAEAARRREIGRRAAAQTGIRASARPNAVGSGITGFGLHGPVAQEAAKAAGGPEALSAVRRNPAADLVMPEFGRSPFDPAPIQAATQALSAYKAELETIARQKAEIETSGNPDLMPALGGLDARKAEVERLVSDMEARIKALNAETIAPQVDPAGLSALDQAADATKAKLDLVDGATVSPKGDPSGLAPVEAILDRIGAKLRELGSQIGVVKAQAASVSVPSAPGKQASSGLVRREQGNNFA